MRDETNRRRKGRGKRFGTNQGACKARDDHRDEDDDDGTATRTSDTHESENKHHIRAAKERKGREDLSHPAAWKMTGMSTMPGPVMLLTSNAKPPRNPMSFTPKPSCPFCPSSSPSCSELRSELSVTESTFFTYCFVPSPSAPHFSPLPALETLIRLTNPFFCTKRQSAKQTRAGQTRGSDLSWRNRSERDGDKQTSERMKRKNTNIQQDTKTTPRTIQPQDKTLSTFRVSFPLVTPSHREKKTSPRGNDHRNHRNRRKKGDT